LSLLYVQFFYLSSKPKYHLLLGSSLLLTKLTLLPYVIINQVLKFRWRGIVNVILIFGVFSITVFLLVRCYEDTFRMIGVNSRYIGSYGNADSTTFFDLNKSFTGLLYLISRNPILFIAWSLHLVLSIINWSKIDGENKVNLLSLYLSDIGLLFIITRHASHSYYLVPLIVFFMAKLFLTKDIMVYYLFAYKKGIIVLMVFSILPIAYLGLTKYEASKQLTIKKLDQGVIDWYNKENPNNHFEGSSSTVEFANFIGQYSRERCCK